MAVVVEPIRACNLKCKMCPTVYVEDYPKGIMPMNLFEKILNDLVDMGEKECALTGWGEPLMDPFFFKRLNMLKERGFFVGTTTNATFLTEGAVKSMVYGGLDHLTVSVDLFHLESSGMNVDEVVEKFVLIGDIKRRAKADNPALYATVVVSKDNLDVAKSIVEKICPLVFGVGVVPVFMIPNKEIYRKLPSKSDLEDLKSYFYQRGYTSVSFPYLDPPPKNDCRSGVFQNYYVSIDGTVSPCCVLAMRFPMVTFEGVEGKSELYVYGDLKKQSLKEVMESSAVISFRGYFLSGSIPPQCRCCNAWRVYSIGENGTNFA